MTEVKAFYRYLRPVTFDRTRFETVAKTTGGVSFAVTTYTIENGVYNVTLAVAVCPSSQPYDRTVAKRILDTRVAAGHLITIMTTGLDAESIAKGIVWTADGNQLKPIDDADFYQTCIAVAIQDYADAVEYILRSHRSAEFLKKASSGTIEALGIGDLYREASSD